jgi:hypothetical protein
MNNIDLGGTAASTNGSLSASWSCTRNRLEAELKALKITIAADSSKGVASFQRHPSSLERRRQESDPMNRQNLRQAHLPRHRNDSGVRLATPVGQLVNNAVATEVKQVVEMHTMSEG